MKKGWQTKSIGEVCEIMNGGTPKTDVAKYWDGDHLWITPAEMGKRLSPYVSDTERKITDSGLHHSSARLLPPNSVILSSRAPIGHLVINTAPMATNQGCKGIIPGPQLQHKFLYYYLSSIVDLLNSLGTGTTFKELSGGKLKTVTIPIPPLHEQERIIGILDKALENIAITKANTEKNLQNAHAIFESHLQSVFTKRGAGWVDKRLGDLFVFKNGRAFKKVEWTTRGLPIIRIQNLNNAEALFNYFAGKYNHDILVEPGDLLFSWSGTVGSSFGSHLWRGKTGVLNQHIFKVGLSPLIAKGYAFYGLRQITKAIEQSVSGAVGLVHITKEKLNEFTLPIPSPTEQSQITENLNSLNEETQRLVHIYEQKLAVLESLKKSLLHQAFAGAL